MHVEDSILYLEEIEGRIQEYFISKTGSLIFSNYSHVVVWDVKDKTNAYQFVQNEPGKVLLYIDAISKFSASDIENIKMVFQKYHYGFEIEIKFVDDIPRTKSGKFKYLVKIYLLFFK